MNLRDILCAKDVKSSYQLFVQLEQQAGEDPALFREYPLYLEMLESRSSYIRVRGFRMLCAAAKWDTQGVIRENLTKILAELGDDKPSAVRQCMATLPGLVTGRPELTWQICQAVSELDLSKYRESMAPLIRGDAEAFLKQYG